jgi:peroxin-19
MDALTQEFLATVQRLGSESGLDANEVAALLAQDQRAPASAATSAASATAASASAASATSGASASAAEAPSAEDLAARLRHIAASSREANTASAASTAAGGIPGLSGEADEAMLERVLQQLDDEPGMQGAMQELVQQIMAKDVLYEPMVELRDKYPQWLARNQLALSTDDRVRYTRQHELIGHICAEYERPNVDYERLTDLMAAVQELGQPPKEIVSELAPDLVDGQGQPQVSPENCVVQ